MEYRTLGQTGMKVSRLCLGCMSFGSSNWRNWVLDEPESRPIIERAIDLGINFFDTANMYSQGASERILGNVLDDYERDQLVVATKVFHPMGDRPNKSGLSRKAIEQELDHSLERLGVDTVDLYYMHRWDYETPITQTVRTMQEAVHRGQIRHPGASSMWAHQFADALRTAERNGSSQFVSMQNHYNLVYREEEREMLPLCARENVGIVPWSPLARGYLTRPHENHLETVRSEYMDSDSRMVELLDAYEKNGGATINERVEELAEQRDVTMAQLALAWLLHKDVVDAPIVGTTSITHLEEAVEALELSLSASDIQYLEEPYEPVPVVGHE